jgi:hypothetical protein
MSAPAPRTVGRIIEICERRKALVLYLGGGGLGGLGIFGAGDAASGVWQTAPAMWRTLFFTFALLTAYCFARAYGGYEYQATQLARRIADGELDTTVRLSGREAMPVSAKVFYYASTILLVVTASCLLAAAWASL